MNFKQDDHFITKHGCLNYCILPMFHCGILKPQFSQNQGRNLT